MILGVDCDLTVVDPIPKWIEWLVTLTGCRPFLPSGERSYDITAYWNGLTDVPKEAMFDFWREKYLYDDLQPIVGAVEALGYLHTRGHTIRFVSHCKGYHMYSKVNFLKKHFPFMDGFVATKEKWCLAADCLIDDRIKHLTSTQFKHKILFPSMYTQDAPLTKEITVATGWEDIPYILER